MGDRTVEDRELVRTILAGDAAGFSTLIDRHQKMATGVAWRYGVPGSEIEDVVSEIFVKTYCNLHRYRPEHAFSTWFYRLAANHVIDHGRRARRERGRSALPDELTDPAPGAAEAAEARERVTLLRAALSDVPVRFREALFLVYVEDLKLDEAARALGVPQGTIKTRLMRGRAALRKLLARRHPEHFGG